MSTTLTDDQVIQIFGRFEYHDDPKRKGAIIVAADWIVHSIARIEPPFDLRAGTGQHIGVIPCHHLVADDLSGILAELLAQRLQHLITTWDGTWVPRHQLWKSSKPLSRHSWGIAVDLNAYAYPYGSKRQQNPQLITLFTKRGWVWGGTWSTPDPMHFEVGPRWLELHATGSAGVPPASGELHGEIPADGVTVYVDGKLLPWGRLIAGSVYLPARAVAEAFGATVTWDPATRTVRITRP